MPTLSKLDLTMTLTNACWDGQTGVDRAALNKAAIVNWIQRDKFDVLNIAGPRASKTPVFISTRKTAAVGIITYLV